MIRINSWEKFQHYKHRRPPWIRLYRDLLDRREWRELSPGAAKLLVDCWLLAAESGKPGEDNHGVIECSAAELAWRLRMDAPLVIGLLRELEEASFIEWEEGDASGMLAAC